MEAWMDHQAHGGKGSYLSLAAELAIDFVIMYLVMYTMIDTLDHFHLNLNNVYMTMMMVAPMAVIMLLAMRSMFPSRRANIAIVAVAAALFAASFYGMRAQAAIGDREFLKSMIPHHSGAILMCQEASIRDAEIAELCRQIVKAQKQEIAQMEAILARL
jgi:uncharacterized protein (DUF305 family)